MSKKGIRERYTLHLEANLAENVCGDSTHGGPRGLKDRCLVGGSVVLQNWDCSAGGAVEVDGWEGQIGTVEVDGWDGSIGAVEVDGWDGSSGAAGAASSSSSESSYCV